MIFAYIRSESAAVVGALRDGLSHRNGETKSKLSCRRYKLAPALVLDYASLKIRRSTQTTPVCRRREGLASSLGADGLRGRAPGFAALTIGPALRDHSE